MNVKYPIGIQNFESLRKDGYIYVDKTEFIYRLVSNGKYYFLGRPRRFGKSLLLSTIKAYFEGKKELFEGLSISCHDDLDWTPRPVIHIDLNGSAYSNPDSLRQKLDAQLGEYERIYHVENIYTDLGTRFMVLIQAVSNMTGKRVAVLIDEYDKPILDTFHDGEISRQHKDSLRGFYSVLKSMDEYLCFVMLTGVTKYGHLNIFSGLNNLLDISLDDRYSAICGITDVELQGNFRSGIDRLSKEWGVSEVETLENLKKNYDGYHFSEKSLDIYNPYSLINCFETGNMDDFWFVTGTPSFLVRLLQERNYPLKDLDEIECSKSDLYGIDVAASDPVPVLYQSGYLTIKDYNPEFRLFSLRIPNREVRTGFYKALLPFYSGKRNSDVGFDISRFVNELRKGDAENFMKRLQSFFATIPYDMRMEDELNFQNVMYILFMLMGLYTEVEYHTSNGRIDILIKTDRFIYIIELKVDSSAGIAMDQISDKGYFLPFQTDCRKTIRIGINFSRAERRIDDYIIMA